MIKRVCAYGRVSTKYTEQESSLVTQQEMFRRWIETHKSEGYQLVNEVYEQKSGTLATKRPKFMQMVEDAKNGMYDTLLFKDSKRFSRNATDFLLIVDELRKHNVNIIFIIENIDTDKLDDRFLLGLFGLIAESYSNQLHTNLQKSLKTRFDSELGRVPGDVFGYKRHKGDTSHADIVEEQASVIRELFERYAEGEGIASITQDFIDRDIRTYRGGRMSMFALRRYIRNPLYKGLLVMNKMKTVNVRTQERQINDESLWIVRERPDLQIVSPDLWQKCNDIMDKNQRHMQEITKGKIGYKHNILTNKLFSKVVVCGCCGRNYNRKESNHRDTSKRYIYLMCGYKKYSKKNQANLQVCDNETVIRLDYLVEIVSQVIKDILLYSDGLYEQVEAKIASIMKERQARLSDKCTEEELKKAKDKLKRLAMLFKDGFIEEDEYRRARNEVKELEKQVKQVVNIDKDEIQRLTDKFICYLDNIIKENIVDEGGVDVKAFNKLFDKIVIEKDKIDIIFRAFGGQLGQMELYEADWTKGLNVFVPIVDNNFSGCKSLGQIRKKQKRHEKARWSADRTSEFISIGDNNIDGKQTNQVIVGKRKVKIGVYLI